MGVDLKETKFPSEEFSKEEDTVTHRCTSFGEAAIMIANDPNILGTTDFFKCFIMDSLKAPLSGLHIMTMVPIMRMPSSFSSTLGKMMNMLQRVWLK